MADSSETPHQNDPSEASASVTAGSTVTNRASTNQVEQNFREHGRELWAMFYAVCCDSERAWDAVQHAFLKLQEQNGTPIHDARAWLLQVGKNWLRDVARRREHAWRAPQGTPWDDVADRELDPANSAGKADLLQQVRGLLEELKVEDREVLLMRYALGWPSARIAATLESSVPAIDMRLSRARQRLAVLLTAAGIDAESME